MLEKDRFELVKLKTQSGKVDNRVTDLQKENATQKDKITELQTEVKQSKAREKDLLAQISKL